MDDLEKARAMRPDAVLLGCNQTAALVPEIKHVWMQDAHSAGKLVRAKIPADVSIHTAKQPVKGQEVLFEADYYWPDLAWASGTSGFAAGLWAKHGLGFDEVILAGVPLSKSVPRYLTNYPSPNNIGEGKPVIGYTEELFEHWCQQIRAHKMKGQAENIFSMSGATAHILGMPNA